jgi:uncharacterized membrane protein YjjP (DUF1212 family)
MGPRWESEAASSDHDESVMTDEGLDGWGDSDARERALEPVELVRQSHTIIRMGRLMLSAGTASYRVKEAMQRAAQALGVTRHHAHVTLTEITATSHRGPIFRTEVTEVRQVTVNADRIARLDNLKDQLSPGWTAERLNAALDAIEAKKAPYAGWANALFAGFACGAFAVLNNARLFEIIAVMVAATAGQFLRRSLVHRGFNHFGTTMIAATFAATGYLVVVAAINAAHPGAATQSAGFVSAVLFLVPGFAIITGALDLAKLDFSAGVSRTAFAVMIFIASGIGLWGVSLAAGLQPGAGEPFAVTGLTIVVIRAVASFVGVLGFALMFNSPLGMALAAAVIGALANVGRIWLVDRGWVIQAATVVACVAVGVLAAFASKWWKYPHITLSVPATLIMIPGARVYKTMVSLNGGVSQDAVVTGLDASLVLLAIAVGLVIAKLLTDPAWSFEKVRKRR